MFKCDMCKKVTEYYEPMEKSVIEVRSTDYSIEIKRRFKSFTVKSKGYQIVKEISTCTKCTPLAKEKEASTIAPYVRKISKPSNEVTDVTQSQSTDSNAATVGIL